VQYALVSFDVNNSAAHLDEKLVSELDHRNILKKAILGLRAKTSRRLELNKVKPNMEHSF
jgi:hypothetical protein